MEPCVEVRNKATGREPPLSAKRVLTVVFAALLLWSGWLGVRRMQSLWKNHERWTAVKLLAHEAMTPYFESHGRLPELQGNLTTNWRNVLRSSIPREKKSHIDLDCFKHHGMIVFGIDSANSPWGKAHSQFPPLLDERDTTLPFPLLVAVVKPENSNSSVENDVWTEDVFLLVNRNQGKDGIPCFTLGTDFSVNAAFFHPLAGRELTREGQLASGLW